jgi:hypothetical protein
MLFSTHRLSIAIGKLPMARRFTICQLTEPRLLCTQPPTILVNAAYSRSVPTAVAGAMPNSNTNSGVIREPPPTPVAPTISPTQKPDNV